MEDSKVVQEDGLLLPIPEDVEAELSNGEIVLAADLDFAPLNDSVLKWKAETPVGLKLSSQQLPRLDGSKDLWTSKDKA